MSVFQDLYSNEINFSVKTFWDGGFDLALGDDMNGIKATGNVDRWGQVEQWFIEATTEHYPNSLFARMYRDGESAWLTQTANNAA